LNRPFISQHLHLGPRDNKILAIDLKFDCRKRWQNNYFTSPLSHKSFFIGFKRCVEIWREFQKVIGGDARTKPATLQVSRDAGALVQVLTHD
jgi:hypothetical protein